MIFEITDSARQCLKVRLPMTFVRSVEIKGESADRQQRVWPTFVSRKLYPDSVQASICVVGPYCIIQSWGEYDISIHRVQIRLTSHWDVAFRVVAV